VFVDEPTAGMDPAGVARIREILVGLRARGAAVLLNSHLLSEVERICDRVLFIKGGRLLRTHDVRGAGRHVEVRLRNPRHVLAAHPEATLEGDRLRLAIPSEDAVPALVRDLVGQGAEIVEVVLKGAELEELYLKLVEPAG
ncbi:MAG TPA: hypothetical protein VIR81_00325, partial [Myxococcales bacterium]